MSVTNSMRAMAVLAAGGLVLLGAGSDAGDDVAGPPIPTLGATSAGNGSGVTTVAGGTMNATCANCVEWSCTIGDCGYDPATDPRGACCLDCDFSQPAVSKPSCEGNPGHCSSEPNAAEYGVDICTPGSEPYGYGCQTCPGEFTCCYGGHYGDPVVY